MARTKKTVKEEKTKNSRLSLGRQQRGFVRASFDSAQTTPDNMSHWSLADGLSADNEANAETRRILRQRARYEIANNSYARGLVLMLANDCIGTGPRLQMHSGNGEVDNEIEEAFRKWAEAAKLSRALRLMKKARCQDGESFAVMGTNPKLKSDVKLKIDVIEADQICGDIMQNEFAYDYVDGIKFDRYGNPEWYSMLKYHPGDEQHGYVDQYVKIPSEYMIHTFVPSRPGLHRGVTEINAALPLFAQLRRYNLATLSAAEAAADFAAVLYTDAPASGEADEVEPLDAVQLRRNMMVTMPAGWKLGQLDSKHPTSNHSEYVKSILAEIARCVCATYGAISGDFSGYNYSSGRLDAQIYQKMVLVDRSVWEEEVLDVIFDEWIREFSLVSGISVEDDSHEWFWDGFMHVDPAKEANAQQTRLANGTTTLSDEYAKQGQDWQKKLEQRAREKKFARQLGLDENTVPEKQAGDDEDE